MGVIVVPCGWQVTSAGGTMLYEEDLVMTNDGGSGFSGLQGCALAVPMTNNSGDLIGVLAFTRENSSLPFGEFEEVLVEVPATPFFHSLLLNIQSFISIATPS
jgi:hypothetical protein